MVEIITECVGKNEQSFRKYIETDTGLVGIFDRVNSFGIPIYKFETQRQKTHIKIPDGRHLIKEEEFAGYYNLRSIAIPNSIEDIDCSAFMDCVRLDNVKIPNGVKSIGVDAFGDCVSLKHITIPNSIKRIGKLAFQNCISLISEVNNYKVFKLNDDKIFDDKGNVYKENQWSEEVKDIKIGESGYHYCTNLFELFNYLYSIHDVIDYNIAIYECEVGDKVQMNYSNNRSLGVTKNSLCVTNKIKPVKRLYMEDVINLLNV